MIPVIAIVGRPNVGKSTLFNELTKTRNALVVDTPGVTRDRIYGEGKIGTTAFIVVDTGGLGNFEEELESKMESQAWLAISEADILFFMVDGRVGCTGLDELLANKIRQHDKPVYVLVNKTDGLNPDLAAADFYTLGLGRPIPIAASHGRGLTQLMEHTFSSHAMSASNNIVEETPAAETQLRRTKIAVVGRPNVGKSTLVNRVLGEERVIVLDEPGTTRDSIYIPFERQGHRYTLIDTAGIRRRARVTETIEKFSVVKTLQAIEACDVVLLILDARVGILEQDLGLLGFVLEAGRSLVVALNKWDGLTQEHKLAIRKSLRQRLSFVDYAKVHFISALQGTGVSALLSSVRAAYRAATKDISTSQLNRVLAEAVAAHPPPMVQRYRIKLRYAHMGGHRPPVIVVHGNQTERVPDSYKRYLMNTFRQAFQLVGTPIRMEFVTSENPFKGRRNTLTPRQEYKRQRLRGFHKKKS